MIPKGWAGSRAQGGKPLRIGGGSPFCQLAAYESHEMAAEGLDGPAPRSLWRKVYIGLWASSMVGIEWVSPSSAEGPEPHKPAQCDPACTEVGMLTASPPLAQSRPPW